MNLITDSFYRLLSPSPRVSYIISPSSSSPLPSPPPLRVTHPSCPPSLAPIPHPTHGDGHTTGRGDGGHGGSGCGGGGGAHLEVLVLSLSFAFVAAILEPNLDLRRGELEEARQVFPLRCRQVTLLLEPSLQLVNLSL